MARLILKEQLPLKIVVIGNVETYEPSNAYFSTGSYVREDLPGLLEMHDVGICFLPSICPETFSFVASEVMQLKFPLACFNLGAQAERVAAYDRGFIIDEPTAESALRRILKIVVERQAGSNIFAEPIKTENNPAGVVEA
ncbi:MAG: glycosyltransferase, partial [Arenimonas sp.]